MALDYYFDPDDKLDRFGYAKFLRDLIENCDQYKRDEFSEAYSIAIDSSWGTGKTYFFNMFENYLYGKKSKDDHVPKSTPEFIVVNYNAWSNDYWDDAFAPFMQAILDNNRFMGTDSKSKLRRIFESIIQSSDSTPAKIYTNYRSNSPLVQLRQKQQAIQDLKECLNKMIISCKNSGLKKLVIIIDELDRCKPLFAIQTLEIVKHFLDVKDVVFIFAIDLEQLSHSIESVYGSGMDASGYLCKFFDYITKFPQSNIIQIIKEEIKSIKKLNVIIPKLNDSGLEPIPEIANFIHLLYVSFSLSIRDVQTILKCYRIMIHTFLHEYPNHQVHLLYLLFLTIKYKSPEKYQTLLTKSKDYSSIISNFPTSIKQYYASFNFLKKAINAISQNKYAFITVPYYGSDQSINVRSIDLESISPLTVKYRNIIYHIDDSYAECGVLFGPDFKHLDVLKKITFADYIFTRLENFNFPDIIKSTQ